MKLIFAEDIPQDKYDILSVLEKFKTDGTLIGNGSRNIIKIFELNGLLLNFKSFKQHNIINRHVYKFYRKSKARRSFEYAHMLLSKNYYTPKPVAYIENHDLIGLTSSFYISVQLENIRTFTDILGDHTLPEREKIIKEYTSLIYRLHNDGIEFIDNSPNNFLIKEEDNKYCIYLVDLNRMNFHKSIDLDKRLKNFARLTTDPEIIKIIANEYALLSKNSPEYCEKKMIEASNRLLLKRKIKKVLKLYKRIIKI